MQTLEHLLPTIIALTRKFRGDPARLHLLHAGVGLVYETVRNEKPMILKVNLSDRDRPQSLQARLHWIQFLGENGMLVPELLLSTEDKLVEETDAENEFYSAYAYHKINLSQSNEINWMKDLELPFKLGAVMGKMHRLAKYYSPTNLPAIEQWDDADWIYQPEKIIHPSQTPVIEAICHLHQQITRLQRTGENYGLIHDDLHTGNVYHLDGELLIIDFDLLHFSWYAADIASTVLFRVWIGPEKEKPELQQSAAGFLHGLVRGYQTEEALPPGWEAMLPLFLKLREISLFQSFFRGVSVEQGLNDPFFAYVYDSIVNNRPFLKGIHQVE